ncbi:Phytocyanin domain [Dillenia turbinata]|uniref:Basic blue protein n=1 Tax=Dillenia turbinata TaxID=194707 RepID=A0AAN8ZK43_9MAGN
MPSQGRGSATKALAMSAILLVSLTLHLKTAQAIDYVVGDAEGWTFTSEGWGKGKTFKAGDNLIFKYDNQLHNVAIVDANTYNTCKIPPGTKSSTSGNDKIALKEGTNYFVCTILGHCDAGVRLRVTAS